MRLRRPTTRRRRRWKDRCRERRARGGSRYAGMTYAEKRASRSTLTQSGDMQMLSNCDSYRTDGVDWRRAEKSARHQEHLRSHFLKMVDRLFYATAVAFAGCVIMLVIG